MALRMQGGGVGMRSIKRFLFFLVAIIGCMGWVWHSYAADYRKRHLEPKRQLYRIRSATTGSWLPKHGSAEAKWVDRHLFHGDKFSGVPKASSDISHSVENTNSHVVFVSAGLSGTAAEVCAFYEARRGWRGACLESHRRVKAEDAQRPRCAFIDDASNAASGRQFGRLTAAKLAKAGVSHANLFCAADEDTALAYLHDVEGKGRKGPLLFSLVVGRRDLEAGRIEDRSGKYRSKSHDALAKMLGALGYGRVKRTSAGGRLGLHLPIDVWVLASGIDNDMFEGARYLDIKRSDLEMLPAKQHDEE